MSHSGALGAGRWVRSAASLLAAAMVTTAAAQVTFSVTGTVTGTLDGEERAWNVLEYDAGEGPDSTSWLRTLSVGPVTLIMLEVQAHPGERFAIEGTLVLGGVLGSLEGCPCAVSEPEVTYVPTESLFEDVYKSLDAEVVVSSLERSADGTYRVTGTFRALLGHVGDIRRDRPDPDMTMRVEGRFALDHVFGEE